MIPHKRYFSVALCSACLCIASVANAGSTALFENQGGWSAFSTSPYINSISIDSITPDALVIEISKDFYDGPGIGGVFPAVLIDFVQVGDDANTVTSIVIEDETVTNSTGVDWTDFHWQVLDSGQAWFNVSESSPFSVNPFTNKTFTGVSGNTATGLNADGGVVLDGTSFFPGGAAGDGHLVIDVDLGNTNPVSFLFKQFPTPEPATLALLAMGGLAVIRRRRA